MRVNINLKNFRNRNKDGLVVEGEAELDLEKVEPRRRKIARELKEKEIFERRQNSRITKFKEKWAVIKNKLVDKVKLKENLKKTSNSYYFLFGATVLIGVVGLALNINTYKGLEKEKYTTYTLNNKSNIDSQVNENIKFKEDSSSINQKAEEIKTVKTNSTNVTVSNKKVVENNSAKQVPKIVQKTTYVFKYILPIKYTKTLKPFSIDNVVYSKTLDMWKIHEGIDFSADIGIEVIAVEKGIIEKIYTDSLYGVSIILNHNNGYKSIYRNLDKNIIIKEGQSVIKGQKIAVVGTTAGCEIEDESHLHFEAIKGADIVNPSVIGIF